MARILVRRATWSTIRARFSEGRLPVLPDIDVLIDFERARVQNLLAALILILVAPAPALAQTSGANKTHDPSRIVEADGRFYFCSTGGGCASSRDGLVWNDTGLRLPIPAWATKYEPNGNQGVWAPDIVFFNGKYHIYYSFCGLPAAQSPCVIALYTTPTLDSTSPIFKLTDAGLVVNNPQNDATYQFSTIDPGPIIDTDGKLWSSWGSGYGKDQTKTQLWVTRMGDNGLPLSSDPAYLPPTVLGHALEPGRKEGSYLHHRGSYYYLFYNTGKCCDGTASDYTIWVARSSSITGPFTGDKIFYASSGNIHGPGHMGIYSACGVERFTYHYYPSATSILGENELSWGSDGWPVAGPPSTTPLIPCANPSGGAGGTNGSTGGSGGSSSGAGGTTGNSEVAGAGGKAGNGEVAGAGSTNTAGAGGAGGSTNSVGAAGAMNGASGSSGGNADAIHAGAGRAGDSPISDAGKGGAEHPSSTNADSGSACTLGRTRDHGDALVWLTAFASMLASARSRRRRSLAQ